MKITMSKESIKEGTYIASFESLEKHQGTQYGEFYKFTFTIREGEHNNQKINGLTSTSFNAESKLYKWLTSILGRQIDPE